MNGRQALWFVAAAVLTLLVSISAPAFPLQEEAPAEPQRVTEEASTEDEGPVEAILREQEQLLQGQRFSYDPAGRRDPFRSLFESVRVPKGPRPRGIAGMLVSELDLSGIVWDPTAGNVGMVVGSDNKGYFLKVGDKVFDGTVIAVDPRLGTVTFRQQIDDPRMIKPYRDVVKRLVPLSDEESGDEQ